jgi:hypothetical protein
MCSEPFLDQGQVRADRERNIDNACLVITVNATSTCSHDAWKVDGEVVGTEFHGSAIFRKTDSIPAQ